MTTAVNRFIEGLPAPLRIAFAGATVAFTLFQSTRKVQWDAFWASLPGPVSTYLTIANSNAGGGLGAIAIMMAGWFAARHIDWTRHWGQVAVSATAGILAINRNVSGNLPVIIRSLSGFFVQAMPIWNGGWAVVTSMVGIWFGRIKGAIDVGISIAVTAVSAMPQGMLQNLFNFVGSFYEAGSSLITAFVQGISSGQHPAVAAAIAVVKAAMSVLPHSPAEKGPLSGQGWINLKKSGTAITKQFASGFEPGLVQTASGNVVRAVQFNGASASTSSVRSAASTTSDRALVNIGGDYYGATPEKVADEFDKKLRRASLTAQLGKVGI
jgi:hypothetical protein